MGLFLGCFSYRHNIAGDFVKSCWVFVWDVSSKGMLVEGSWKLCLCLGRDRCICLCCVGQSEYRSKSGICSKGISGINACGGFLEGCGWQIDYGVGRGILLRGYICEKWFVLWIVK